MSRYVYLNIAQCLAYSGLVKTRSNQTSMLMCCPISVQAMFSDVPAITVAHVYIHSCVVILTTTMNLTNRMLSIAILSSLRQGENMYRVALTYMYIDTCTHSTNACTQSFYKCTRTYVCIHAHTYAHTHTYTYTYTQTHRHTHTHVYTH